MKLRFSIRAARGGVRCSYLGVMYGTVRRYVLLGTGTVCRYVLLGPGTVRIRYVGTLRGCATWVRYVGAVRWYGPWVRRADRTHVPHPHPYPHRSRTHGTDLSYVPVPTRKAYPVFRVRSKIPNVFNTQISLKGSPWYPEFWREI